MNKPIHYVKSVFKQYRDDRGWSRKQMADFLTLQLGRSLTGSTIQKWEEQRMAVNAETALDLAKALQIDVMELVERKNGQ
jgi:ribosome-binding protein aMBF1 (putative translation factor)